MKNKQILKKRNYKHFHCFLKKVDNVTNEFHIFYFLFFTRRSLIVFTIRTNDKYDKMKSILFCKQKFFFSTLIKSNINIYHHYWWIDIFKSFDSRQITSFFSVVIMIFLRNLNAFFFSTWFVWMRLKKTKLLFNMINLL